RMKVCLILQLSLLTCGLYRWDLCWIAAGWRVSVAGVFEWRSELSALHARLGELFGRAEPRRQAGLYLEGLLSAVERRTAGNWPSISATPGRGARNGCSRMCSGTKRRRATCVAGTWLSIWPIERRC